MPIEPPKIQNVYVSSSEKGLPPAIENLRTAFLQNCSHHNIHVMPLAGMEHARQYGLHFINETKSTRQTHIFYSALWIR